MILRAIMKTTSATICKTKRRLKLPRPPKVTDREPLLTGHKLIQWLKAQGAEPVDPETKRRLIASGNWGMPDE